jgi:hypothetical protein
VESPRFCRRCLYCVIESGADAPLSPPGAPDGPQCPARCPECGREFDPFDARSTLRAPKRVRSRRARLALYAIIALGIVFVYANGLEPRRVGGSWTLWRWLGLEYGYDDGLWVWTSKEYGRITSANGAIVLEVVMHAGVAHSVEARRVADGARLYRISRATDGATGKSRWRAEVDLPDEAWAAGQYGSLLSAFNLTRDTIFGVQVGPVRIPSPGWSITGGGGTMVRPDPHPAPFTVEGTEADLLWRFCEEYMLSVSDPALIPRRSDGWHPTLAPGEPDAAELRLNRPPASPRAARRLR